LKNNLIFNGSASVYTILARRSPTLCRLLPYSLVVLDIFYVDKFILYAQLRSITRVLWRWRTYNT